MWKAPLFLRTPYEGFYIEPRFGNLLVDVHASVEDEQDPGGILMQGVEDIVSALENQPSDATCSVPDMADLRILTDCIANEPVDVALNLSAICSE